MEELARRTHKLPPPVRVLWADLVAPRREGARIWLELADDEQWPAVLEAVENERVVWSSLWKRRPDDRIVFEISPAGDGSKVEVVWLAAPPLPGHASPFRYRLTRLIAEELRLTYGQ